MGGGSGDVCTPHPTQPAPPRAPGPAAPPLLRGPAPPLRLARLRPHARVFPPPRLCPGGSPAKDCSLRFPFEERPTLQGPALCSGPQFPHLHTKGVSCGLRRREGRPGPLLLPVVPSSGQAALLVGDSVSPTVPCGARLGLHPGPSLFFQRDPPEQGEQFLFWASVYPSATQRRST